MDESTSPLETYCIQNSHSPSPLCEELAAYTRTHVPDSVMLTGRVVVSTLGTLIRLLGVKRILEVGTYTGYSALAMAEHLPEAGELVTLDINSETVEVGKKFWRQSPHGKKITSVVGPAAETIEALKGKFDLVYIDANKPGYIDYLKKSLSLLNPHGLIVADNTLFSGQVLEPNNPDVRGKGIRAFNDYLRTRNDLFITLLPICDGLTLILKKA